MSGKRLVDVVHEKSLKKARTINISSTEDWQIFQSYLDSLMAELDVLLAHLEEENRISAREFMLLRRLAIQQDEEGGHFKMKELAVEVGLSPSATTRLVSRLERRDLLTRYVCPTDRRGMYVDVTPQGKTVLQKAEQLSQTMFS